jgi:gliding motility-associated-like protein
LAAGSYTFYVEESNGSCSSLRSPVAVVVNAAPAAPAASGTTICSGASATLSATGSGVIQWYADAALTNLLATGSTFNTPALTTNTTYHVAASSSAGCLSTGTSLNVTVTALPAAPVATGATVCAGNPATLTASAGAGTLTWFADPGGSVSVGTGASFTTPFLNQTTAYYVRETASGCQSTLTQVTATVNALPTAPAGTAPAVCAGAPVILNGFGSGGTLSWFNTAIGGTALGSGNNFNAGILAVGSYTFYVEESNGSCSSLRSPVAVVVNAAPAAPTAQNDGPACEGDDIFLQASNVSGASYNWTGPNGFSSNQQTIMIQSSAVSDAGVYSVAAIVNGCASSTASTTVTVNSLPQISGAISNNGPLCEGENLTLTAPTTAGLTYEWTGPNGYSSTQAVSIVNNVNELDQQGFYTLVVTAANGCSSLPLSTLVEITSLPQAGMAISNGPLCTGSTLNLSVAEVFGVSYSWSGPNGFTSTDRTPSVTPVSAADAGIYTVTVSRNNCQTELDVNVVIDTVPNISVIADTTIESSDELMLYASGGIIYQWSPATFLSSPFSPTTIFAGAPAGTYTLTVFIQDAKGCSAEEQVNITVEASDNIVVTDLFTPNGDGVNETWVIEFLNNVGSYTLQVFSRGGLEVLNSQNYTNDWDGTHYKSGKKLPDGTYYYIIRTDANEYSGAVTIKR